MNASAFFCRQKSAGKQMTVPATPMAAVYQATLPFVMVPVCRTGVY